jgi:hypothetical protein
VQVAGPADGKRQAKVTTRPKLRAATTTDFGPLQQPPSRAKGTGSPAKPAAAYFDSHSIIPTATKALRVPFRQSAPVCPSTFSPVNPQGWNTNQDGMFLPSYPLPLLRAAVANCACSSRPTNCAPSRSLSACRPSISEPVTQTRRHGNGAPTSRATRTAASSATHPSSPTSAWPRASRAPRCAPSSSAR